MRYSTIQCVRHLRLWANRPTASTFSARALSQKLRRLIIWDDIHREISVHNTAIFLDSDVCDIGNGAKYDQR